MRALPWLVPFKAQSDVPIAPAWFADTVELWARRWGRHATTRWERKVGCFVTFFSRRDADPVMAAVQSQERKNEGEPMYWHQWSQKPVRPHPMIPDVMMPGFIPLDIEQLGESGVLERLDKANLWSGRGEYASLDEAANDVVARNDRLAKSLRNTLGDGITAPLEATLRHAHGYAQELVVADVPTSTEGPKNE